MTDRKPPFRADIVGSFLRPERLKEARRQAGLELDSTADDQSASTLSMEELRAIEDECIRELVAFEESIGLKVVTDGEFRRGSWAYDAIGRFEGIDLRRQDGSYGATFVSGFQPPIAVPPGSARNAPIIWPSAASIVIRCAIPDFSESVFIHSRLAHPDMAQRAVSGNMRPRLP